MTEEKRINELNRKIIKNQRRIKNLMLFDDIICIGTLSGIVLVDLSFTIKNYNNPIVQQMSGITLLASVLIGSIPIINLPTKKSIKKREQYREEIITSVNELHGYAIEEDEKIMKKKSKYDIMR